MTSWFEGFSEAYVDVPGARLRVRRHAGPPDGDARPVVLLHGYPQSGAMWHAQARALAEHRPVVVPDLRGYGGSSCLDGEFTFRAMAADVVALMAPTEQDGPVAFDLVGHDRGARVAHRLALDHPTRVASLALLDILPTLTVWRLLGRDDGWLARAYWHWPLLARADVAPPLVTADPVAWLRSALAALGVGDWMDPRALAEYEQCAARPGVAEAWCGDYAAAGSSDLEHDRADEGRTVDVPCLVLWGTRGVVGAQVDPVETWRAWFPAAVGEGVDAGHFLAEERAAEVLAALRAHLAR